MIFIDTSFKFILRVNYYTINLQWLSMKINSSSRIRASAMMPQSSITSILEDPTSSKI